MTSFSIYFHNTNLLKSSPEGEGFSPRFSIINNQGNTQKDTSILLNQRISECKSIEELIALFQSQLPNVQQQYDNIFSQKKQQLISVLPNQSGSISQHLKPTTNGTITS